nr:MAG TPA: hypothetical protein [Caudoviricetes sp.]
MYPYIILLCEKCYKVTLSDSDKVILHKII